MTFTPANIIQIIYNKDNDDYCSSFTRQLTILNLPYLNFLYGNLEKVEFGLLSKNCQHTFWSHKANIINTDFYVSKILSFLR